MRKVISALSALIIFSGCMKEINDPSKNTSRQSALSSTQIAANARQPLIDYGAMVLGPDDISGKETVLKKLGVNYVRYTITVSDWTGSDQGFNRYKKDGYSIVCNVNNDQSAKEGGKPKPFVKDINTYKKKLNDIFTKYKPEVAVIENEETNKDHYSGSMSQYISELSAATTVAHSKGVKVTNGGIHPQGVCYFVWKYYEDQGMHKEADKWMNLTFNSGMKYAAEHPEAHNDLQFYWRQIDTLLNAYTVLDIDFVNMHIYEPINDVGNGITTIPGCIETMADYIKLRTGKPVMSNECGQRNTNTNLVPSMLQAFADGNYRYSIWFSADGKNTKALQNSNLNLRPNGFAYSNFIAAQ